jgi:competence protein ComEC
MVAAGAEPLPDDLQPLYLGLVIGEDRFQPPAQRARFRAAGLTHLLAVSGQNVAFVLSVARPVSGLLGRRSRFVLTGGLLVVFAIVTRLEPSVLRATATAGLAAWASLTGHRQSGLRLLGLAVTALVMVDPFLVCSVGFQLSICASGGILLLGPLLVARLPGPPLLAEPLAVTLAAQAAVLPLLLGYFGPVSVASVPANLLAGWAAGAVMTWGLTGGLAAGMAPEPVSGWLQLPAAGLVRWLDGVAGWAARLPLPALDHRLLAVAAGLGVAAWLLGPARRGEAAGRVRWRAWPAAVAGRVVAARLGVAAVAAAIALGAIPRPPAMVSGLDGGGLWIPAAEGHPSVLVITAGADERLLDALTGSRILAVDVVVVEAGSRPAAELAGAATDLAPAGAVLAPPQHRVVGARRVTTVLAIPTGSGTVVVTPSANRLTVSIVP